MFDGLMGGAGLLMQEVVMLLGRVAIVSGRFLPIRQKLGLYTVPLLVAAVSTAGQTWRGKPGLYSTVMNDGW